MSPAPPTRRSLKRAFIDNSRTAIIMVLDEIPTITGIVVVVAVHGIRAQILLEEAAWTKVLDAALLWIEVALLLSLLAPKAVDLLGELFEAAVVRYMRLRNVWRTGGDDDKAT